MIPEIGFVAWGGEDLIPDTASYRRKREEVRLRITLKYLAETAKAGWWKRRWIDGKIAWGVSAELDPRRKLYSAQKTA